MDACTNSSIEWNWCREFHSKIDLLCHGFLRKHSNVPIDDASVIVARYILTYIPYSPIYHKRFLNVYCNFYTSKFTCKCKIEGSNGDYLRGTTIIFSPSISTLMNVNYNYSINTINDTFTTSSSTDINTHEYPDNTNVTPLNPNCVKFNVQLTKNECNHPAIQNGGYWIQAGVVGILKTTLNKYSLKEIEKEFENLSDEDYNDGFGCRMENIMNKNKACFKGIETRFIYLFFHTQHQWKLSNVGTNKRLSDMRSGWDHNKFKVNDYITICVEKFCTNNSNKNEKNLKQSDLKDNLNNIGQTNDRGYRVYFLYNDDSNKRFGDVSYPHGYTNLDFDNYQWFFGFSGKQCAKKEAKDSSGFEFCAF